MRYLSFVSNKPYYRSLIQLGLPIVVGQLGIILVGLFDNLMVGRFAITHLAAASFVNSIFGIPILFGMGFSLGLIPLVGKQLGQNNKIGISQLLKNSLLANLSIGVLLTLIMGIVYCYVDRLGQPDELLPLIRPYYILQLASLPFILLFNSFKNLSDGIGNTRIPMYIMLICNLLNIIGNYFLIYGIGSFPAMGIVGAGISTLLSRILMLLLFVIVFLIKDDYSFYRHHFREVRLSKPVFKRLYKMGTFIGVQMGLETALFGVTGIMVGWLGTIALASHQILVSVSTLGFMVYYGIGSAIAIRISYYNGKRDIEKVRQTAFAGFHIMFVLATVTALFFLVIRTRLAALYTTDNEVIAKVSTLMFLMAAYQFGDALQITFSNALRGIEDVVRMVGLAFISYFLIAMPFCYICGFILNWGIEGIWSGYPLGLTLTGILLCIRFNRKTHIKQSNV